MRPVAGFNCSRSEIMCRRGLIHLLFASVFIATFADCAHAAETESDNAVRTASLWSALFGRRENPVYDSLPGAATPHPAVARIIVPEDGATAFGSGTLVAVNEKHGLVVTNWHVVRDGVGL